MAPLPQLAIFHRCIICLCLRCLYNYATSSVYAPSPKYYPSTPTQVSYLYHPGIMSMSMSRRYQMSMSPRYHYVYMYVPREQMSMSPCMIYLYVPQIQYVYVPGYHILKLGHYFTHFMNRTCFWRILPRLAVLLLTKHILIHVSP